MRNLKEVHSFPEGFAESRFAGQRGLRCFLSRHTGTHNEDVREVSLVFLIFVNSSWLLVTIVFLAFPGTPQASVFLVRAPRVDS